MGTSWFDEIDNPQPAQPTPGTPKPAAEGRDWLDDIIDRQGVSEKRALIRSIYEQESSSGKAKTDKPNASGARGPMQVTEVAFRDMQQRGYIPKEYKWDNPEHSAEAGVAYIKHGLKTYGDDEKAAAFYFSGPNAIDKNGNIVGTRAQPGGKTVASYVKDVTTRAKSMSTQPAAPTQGGQPADKPIKAVPWEDVIADPSFASLNSDQREAVRQQYFADVVAPTIPQGQEEAVRAAFDKDTQLGWFDNALLSLKQTGREIKEGARGATQGLRATHLTSSMKAVQDYREQAAAARAQGDETTAQEREAQAEQILAEAKKLDAEIVGSDKSSTFVPRASVAKMLGAKTFDEAWTSFKEDPLNIIAGITAQSAPAMAPGLVAAALTRGGAAGAAMMGAGSGSTEYGSALLDFARDNGVKQEEGSLVDFYSNPDNLRAGMSYAATRGGIIGAMDAATAGVASKTLAPKAVTSTAGKQLINVPAQMGVQMAGGAAGEAGAQIATKGSITEPGQVLAEAVGEMATAPADVVVMAKDIAAAPDSKTKANKLRDLAKKLRGEPIEAGAVIDQPEGAPTPEVPSTPGIGGEVVPAQPRQVAGVPVKGPIETREKVAPEDVEVLDAGDAGAGRRPALAAPPPPAPLQIENRPTPEGRTGTIRVDSKGVATPELQSEGAAGAAARERAEGLGTAPVRIPAPPAPAKKKGRVKSVRSEYSANRALADRARPGWTSPSGKSIEEVLAARPRKPETKEPKKKLFGLFSKKAVETPQFKKWFGTSKATDETGVPKVWYRGTATDNDTPRPRQANAIFVAPDPEFAESFSHASLDHARKNIGKINPAALEAIDAKAREQVRKNYEEQGVEQETIDYYVDNVRMTDEWLYAAMDALPVGPNIQPYFVRAERPFDMADAPAVERVANRVMGDKGEATLTSTSKKSSQNINRRDLVAALKRGDWTVLESDEVQKAIRDLGHDSFYVTEGGRKNLAVYSPHQLKSATGNSGEFSTTNPSVTQSRSVKKDTKADGSPVKALQTIVDNFASKNKGAGNIKIRVIAEPDGSIDGLDSLTEGMYLGEDDQIVLVASAFESLSRAQEVLLHEVVGHHGVEAVIASAGPGFERRWIALLEEVQRVRAKGGYASMEAVAKDYKGYPPIVHAMEVLARMAEKGEKHTLLTKAVSMLRDALRALGFRVKMVDSDLIELISKARIAVKKGTNKNTAETRAWYSKLAQASPSELAALKSEQEPGPVWYSALSKAVSALNMKLAPAEGWAQAIRSMTTKGVKPEEIEFSGVLDWLQGQDGKVKREDVIAFLDSNGVKINDVDMGGDFLEERKDYAFDQIEREMLDRNRHGDLDDRETDNAIEEAGMKMREVKTEQELYSLLQDYFDAALSRSILADAEDHVQGLPNAPRYSSYQLGGPRKNYRERLLALSDARAEYRAARFVEIEKRLGSDDLTSKESDALFKERDQLYNEHMDADDGKYSTGHWDQKNVVAHVRSNERVDADGKKVLFIEEIQSDWAQDARKYGTTKQSQVVKEMTAERNKLIDRSSFLQRQMLAAGVRIFGDKPAPSYTFHHPDSGAEIDFETARDLMWEADDKAEKLWTKIRKEQGGRPEDAVPNAPFIGKTDAWVALVLKRMIRDAAENGFDRLAWTTGQQQADRYKLSNAVENLSWHKMPNGNKLVDIELVNTRRLDGDTTVTLSVGPDGKVNEGDARGSQFVGKHVSEVVGKEIGQQIVETDLASLSGDGLRVGGDGMKAFYDNIVVKVANEVSKKIGGEPVSETTFEAGLPVAPGAANAEMAKLRGNTKVTVHSLDITPHMRGVALRGLPLFSKKKQWAPENAAFEVAPGGNSAVKAQWDALPAERRAEITEGIAKTVVPQVAALFTDEKVNLVMTTGGWMGGVNPSAALKMPGVKPADARNIAAAIAYVFDQDAGLHISEKGQQDSIVVVLEPGQDGAALYKSLPGNDKEFIGFTSSGDGVLEFLVDDAAKSAPKLAAHFGPAKVTVVQRGFGFLEPKDYKAARKSLDPVEQITLDAIREQARSLMRISLSPAREGADVSTANVTAKRTWLDSLKQKISVGIDHIFGLGPKGIDVHAALMEKMPNIRPKQDRTPAETIEHAIEHFRSNLLWLHDLVPDAIRARSKLWYIGGNKIAAQMGKFYDITKEQGAGIIAVLSPQRDWFVNVSLARRVLDIWKYQQDYVADDAMYQAAIADRTMQSEAAKEAQVKLAQTIKGKKLSELDDLIEAAAWVRAYDDAFNARSYRVISPEGETMGIAANDDGSAADIQWGSLNTIANAISILRDGSIENISESLGEGHKVRSFFTNIMNPKDATAATIDTHAVAAATLRPLSSDSPEVRNAFGGNELGQRGPVTSSVIGSNGTYGIYHEAYRRAAADRGISPREMQSITWEALRGLFTAAQKRMTFEPVEELWNKYHRGRKTLAQVREELLEIADGIAQPDWARQDPELDGEEEATLEALRLSGAGWNDGVGSGGASVTAPSKRYGLKSVAASNGGSGVVEYSRRPPRPDSVSVDAWHWSHSKLTELSGSAYGSGIRGAEAERLRGAPPQLRKRVYFYTKRNNGSAPFREAGLGPNRHEVRLANLWKSGVSASIKVEPVGTTQSGIFIRDEAATTNAWEQALLNAGYDGYVNGESGTAVVLNSDVPVTYVQTPTTIKSVKPSQPAVPADRSGLVDTMFKFGLGWVGRKLTTPAYDYLVRQGAKIIPERVKHGIVSDYGLEGQYLDAKVDRAANVHKVLRETKNLLDSLSSLTREQSRVAYLWMNEKPDTELEQQLLAQLPAEERAILSNMKKLIDQLGQDAVKAGLLSQDSYERNKMSYLHRVYEKHVDPKDGSIAGGTAKRAAIRAENFKGRGIRHDVADDLLVQNIDEIKEGDMLDRWESRSPTGKVTAVKYLKQGARGPQGYVNAGTWEARFFDKKGKVGLWRDLTPEERHKLGEIEEVRFAFAKTVINGVRDIENARFLKWVADNYATENAPAESIISDPATGYWSTETFKLSDYVKVPDSTIKGTDIKKFGALAGKVVPAAIWNDIRNQLTRPTDGASAAYDALVRGWKVSKTALSPAVHTNNVMSNFIMADIAEVRARDVVKALQTIVAAKRGDAAARALIDRYEDSGADYGSFAGNELSTLYIEPLLEELSKVENNELGLLKMSQIVNLATSGNLLGATKALGAKLSPAKVPFELLLKAYQSEDSVFRLAKFMRETAAGHTDKEAGKMARDSFLDYNINAPWIQTARRSVLPFISFTYRALPLMLKAAVHKPWKFAKYYAVGSILNAAAYAMLGLGGDDEDRERRMLPDELSGNLLGVFPRLVRMPWNDAHGSPVFLDMRRWIPGGDMVDLNQSQAAVPVPSWLSVSGPLSIMMEFFLNKSGFTGKEIVKDTDTKAEAAAKVSDHLFKAFAPNLPLPGPGTIIPGLDRGLFQTYSWQGMLDAGTGRTDAFGRDQSLATSVLSSIGVKARAYPADQLKLQAVQQYQSEAREIQNNIRNLARELSRGGITREKFDDRVEREKAKLQKAGETLRKKIGAESEPPPPQ